MYRLTEGILTKLVKDKVKLEKEDVDFDYYSRGSAKNQRSSHLVQKWRRFMLVLCRFCCSFLPTSTSKTVQEDKRLTELQNIFAPGGLIGVKDKDLHVIKTAHLPILWIMAGPGVPIVALIDRLTSLYNFNHINVGEMLKDEITAGTGREDIARKLMHRGVIIPRRFLNEMIKKEMAKAILVNNIDGFIFSDFPTTFSQARTFIKTISDVDFIMVLKFDTNTVKLCAYNQLELQSHSSRHMCKTKDELKVSVEHVVEKYNNDLRKMYEFMGNKMQVIDTEEKLGDFYRQVMKWIERAMILHDIRPPEVDPPAQFDDDDEFFKD